jgi:hypothetical protein
MSDGKSKEDLERDGVNIDPDSGRDSNAGASDEVMAAVHPTQVEINSAEYAEEQLAQNEAQGVKREQDAKDLAAASKAKAKKGSASGDASNG